MMEALQIFATSWQLAAVAIALAVVIGVTSVVGILARTTQRNMRVKAQKELDLKRLETPKLIEAKRSSHHEAD